MPQQETPEWKCEYDAKSLIGEEPVWVPEDDSLFWIDQYAPSFNRLSRRSGKVQTWPLPEHVGTYGLRPDLSGAVVAMESGIYDMRFTDGQITRRYDAPFDHEVWHFNDGRCDRAGRFWSGTISTDLVNLPQTGGAFYRLDQRGLVAALPDVKVANGLAWSPDSKTMYIADRPNWRILAFDFDLASGTPSNRRVFASVPEGHIPDGATVDAEGGYWSAIAGRGRVLRFLPDGTLDRDVRAPITLSTKIAFGGAGYRTLFLTTGRRMYSAEKLAREPLAGGIFSVDVGVAGLPEPRFAF
jgi:sugar lactone lactonase YvrE